MVKRSLGMVVLLGLLLVGMLASPATAAESDVEFREYDEIVEIAGDSGGEFLPEEYDMPGFFDWIVLPLVILAVVITALVLLRYLMSQPRFSKEAEERSRR